MTSAHDMHLYVTNCNIPVTGGCVFLDAKATYLLYVIYLMACLGNLHFANIIQEDYQNGQRYVYIVQNQVLRSIQQGAYAYVSPQGRTSK